MMNSQANGQQVQKVGSLSQHKIKIRSQQGTRDLVTSWNHNNDIMRIHPASLSILLLAVFPHQYGVNGFTFSNSGGVGSRSTCQRSQAQLPKLLYQPSSPEINGGVRLQTALDSLKVDYSTLR